MASVPGTGGIHPFPPSGFDAGLFLPSDRTSNFTKLPFEIHARNQMIKNPYQMGAVNSFGENGQSERVFGGKHQEGGQQLPARRRTEPGVSKSARKAKRPLGIGSWRREGNRARTFSSRTRVFPRENACRKKPRSFSDLFSDRVSKRCFRICGQASGTLIDGLSP